MLQLAIGFNRLNKDRNCQIEPPPSVSRPRQLQEVHMDLQDVQRKKLGSFLQPQKLGQVRLCTTLVGVDEFLHQHHIVQHTVHKAQQTSKTRRLTGESRAPTHIPLMPHTGNGRMKKFPKTSLPTMTRMVAKRPQSKTRVVSPPNIVVISTVSRW